MRKIARFFVELVTVDPWRKLGAILFAGILWYYLNQQVTGERFYKLEIRTTTAKTWGVEPNCFYIYVPPNKTLLPTAGKEIEISLQGPNKDLSLRNVTAYYEAPEDFNQASVSLSDIRWDPPRVSSLAKKINPDPFILNYSPIESYQLPLTLEHFNPTGNLAEGFEILREQIEFLPSTIKITGPHKSIQRLQQNGFPLIFEPVTLLQQTKSPQYLRLKLHQDLLQAELVIEGDSPLVAVPIRPKSVEIEFDARIYPIATGERGNKLLQEYSMQQSTTGGWVDKKRIATIPGNLKGEITREWLHNNVIFFVDFNLIPDGVNVSDLEISYHLLKRDPTDRKRYFDIAFRSPAGGNNTVTIVKNNHTPNEGN